MGDDPDSTNHYITTNLRSTDLTRIDPILSSGSRRIGLYFQAVFYSPPYTSSIVVVCRIPKLQDPHNRLLQLWCR